MIKYIFAVILLCLHFTSAICQDSTNSDAHTIIIPTIKWENTLFTEAFDTLEKLSGYYFQYNPKDIANKKLNLNSSKVSLHKLLSIIAERTELIVKIRDRNIIVYATDKSNLLGNEDEKFQRTISGYIYDEENSESLIGASVYALNKQIGATTNEYGFYSLTLPEGHYEIRISYIGYHDKIFKTDVTKNRKHNIYMKSSVNEIEEIIIISDRSDNKHQKTQMGQHQIEIKKLDAVPVILGEQDIMKSLQLLPGVKSGSEGTSGIYVRGGGHDQNLVLLDGVPVYNPAHALGIFSVFNSDALKYVNVIKSGHPARYGGRLSSVIDVRMKEGNLKEWHGQGSIGLISSKLSLSGPIIKDKMSVLVSGRRTYADLILSPLIMSSSDQDIDPSLFFHDFNIKLQYKLSDKSRVYLSGYWGRDKFGASVRDALSSQSSLFVWGNAISALRWNFEISPKLFVNTTLTYSDYDINTINENLIFENTEVIGNNYNSGIEDFGSKIDFDWVPFKNHYIRFGGNYTHHMYNPGMTTTVRKIDGEDKSTQRRVIGPDATERVVYVEDDMNFGKISLNVGVHLSSFKVENSTYNSIQPRLGIRYLVDEAFSVKASYSSMAQFLNLVSSEALSLPSDVWVPSTDDILPQYSRQYSLGFGGVFKDLDWEIESYYKEFDNVLSYVEGTTLLNTNPENWESEITQGMGEAYGVEFLLRKATGRLSGWIAYTLSWSNRQFDNINSGEWFPFRFDRRHDISMTGTYQIRDGINLSVNWIYNTGNAISTPQFQYIGLFPRSTIPFVYESGGQKNSSRLSPSHRLDWSLSFSKDKRRYSRTWVIGAFNTYNRKNPFYATTLEETIVDESTGEIIGVTQTIEEKSLLPILPTISYQIKF